MPLRISWDERHVAEASMGRSTSEHFMRQVDRVRKTRSYVGDCGFPRSKLCLLDFVAHPTSCPLFPDDGDFAGLAAIKELVGFFGLAEGKAMRDHDIRMQVPAYEMFEQFFHL